MFHADDAGQPPHPDEFASSGHGGDIDRTDPSAPRGPGRPTVIDDTSKQLLCALLIAGCSRNEAARCAGCSISALKRAVARDPSFAERLKQAEIGREVGELEKVRRASGKSWRAAAWLLRFYNPRRYDPDRRDVYTHEQVLRIVRSVGAKLKSASFDAHGLLGGPDRLEEVLQELSTRQGVRRYLKNP